MTEVTCPKCGATLSVDVKLTVKKEPIEARYLEDIKILFPKDLEELLTFEDSEEHIIIRPRQYLGTQHFAKIATIIREASGEYISAGKESHFRIQKQKE